MSILIKEKKIKNKFIIKDIEGKILDFFLWF